MVNLIMQVIDNYLDSASYNSIRSIFLSNIIDWYWTEVLNDGGQTHDFQFIHGIYTDGKPVSAYFEKLYPLLQKLKVAAIIKIKANLNLPTKEIIEHGYHVDHPYLNAKTAIFYLNTCDGYTAFEDNQKVESKENRIVIFNSSKKHTGTSVTNSNRRVVLNLNYFN
tara:strand:- start:154 stop:651 length:498 start_codon:yes stop_codon:yes gene_type:complete